MMTQSPAAPAPPTELHLKDEHDLSALQALADPSQLTRLILDSRDLSDLRPWRDWPTSPSCAFTCVGR